MTKAQAKTVERIKERITQSDCLDNSDAYELKQFEVREKYGLVWVYSVAGRKGDENAIFRDFRRIRRKIAIGPLGGMTAYVTDDMKMKNKTFRGWNKAMISGYDTRWDLFHDID